MKWDDMSDTVIMIVMWDEIKLGWVNQRTDYVVVQADKAGMIAGRDES